MIGGNARLYDYYFEDDDYDEDEEYFKRQKRKKIIIISVIATILLLFILFTVFSLIIEDPSYVSGLVEQNDFDTIDKINNNGGNFSNTPYYPS